MNSEPPGVNLVRGYICARRSYRAPEGFDATLQGSGLQLVDRTAARLKAESSVRQLEIKRQEVARCRDFGKKIKVMLPDTSYIQELVPAPDNAMVTGTADTQPEAVSTDNIESTAILATEESVPPQTSSHGPTMEQYPPTRTKSAPNPYRIRVETADCYPDAPLSCRGKGLSKEEMIKATNLTQIYTQPDRELVPIIYDAILAQSTTLPATRSGYWKPFRERNKPRIVRPTSAPRRARPTGSSHGYVATEDYKKYGVVPPDSRFSVQRASVEGPVAEWVKDIAQASPAGILHRKMCKDHVRDISLRYKQLQLKDEWKKMLIAKRNPDQECAGYINNPPPSYRSSSSGFSEVLNEGDDPPEKNVQPYNEERSERIHTSPENELCDDDQESIKADDQPIETKTAALQTLNEEVASFVSTISSVTLEQCLLGTTSSPNLKEVMFMKPHASGLANDVNDKDEQDFDNVDEEEYDDGEAEHFNSTNSSMSLNKISTESSQENADTEKKVDSEAQEWKPVTGHVLKLNVTISASGRLDRKTVKPPMQDSPAKSRSRPVSGGFKFDTKARGTSASSTRSLRDLRLLKSANAQKSVTPSERRDLLSAKRTQSEKATEHQEGARTTLSQYVLNRSAHERIYANAETTSLAYQILKENCLLTNSANQTEEKDADWMTLGLTQYGLGDEAYSQSPNTFEKFDDFSGLPAANKKGRKIRFQEDTKGFDRSFSSDTSVAAFDRVRLPSHVAKYVSCHRPVCATYRQSYYHPKPPQPSMNGIGIIGRKAPTFRSTSVCLRR